MNARKIILGSEFKENITPFPVIVEGLNDIVSNHNFNTHSDPVLYVYISDDPLKTYSPFGYRIGITVLTPSVLESHFLFKLEINFRPPFKNKTISEEDVRNLLHTSRLDQLFNKPGFFSENIIDTDILSVSYLVTYILNNIGCNNASDFYIRKSMNFTSGDFDNITVDSEVIIPDVFKRAIIKCSELQIDSLDQVQLILTSSEKRDKTESLKCLILYCKDKEFTLHYVQKFTNQSDILHRLAFRYSEGIWFHLDTNNVYKAELFITNTHKITLKLLFDYFFFLNPHLSLDDLVVSVDFRNCIPNRSNGNPTDENLYISDYVFSFYPDGSEDSPEKLKKCIMALEKERTSRPPRPSLRWEPFGRLDLFFKPIRDEDIVEF